MSDSPPDRTQPRSKKRVLVVEDDEGIRSMLQKMLAKDYTVVVAQDGQQGLLLAQKAKPDLLLLDVALPGIDGFDLATQIREEPNLKDVPLIFLTARDTPADTIKGIQAGAKHYITKPFKMSDVLKKLEHILIK
jgi:DNA-binding response OmpR family regulator